MARRRSGVRVPPAPQRLQDFEFLEKKQARIGEPAPDFTLKDLEGKTYRLSSYRGKIVVLDWWSAECPASRRYDDYFNARYQMWREKGVEILGIDSNAIYDDNFIRQEIEKRGILFPILRDYEAKVADLYGALTTPHVFVVDREGILRYEGAVDDQTWTHVTPKVIYLDQVIEALLANREPPFQETQPFGCSVKRNWSTAH